jgi:hypothetical protein
MGVQVLETAATENERNSSKEFINIGADRSFNRVIPQFPHFFQNM